MVCCSGDRLVREYALLENVQASAVRVFAALSDLLVNGEGVLLFRAEPRINCAPRRFAYSRCLFYGRDADRRLRHFVVSAPPAGARGCRPRILRPRCIPVNGTLGLQVAA